MRSIRALSALFGFQYKEKILKKNNTKIHHNGVLCRHRFIILLWNKIILKLNVKFISNYFSTFLTIFLRNKKYKKMKKALLMKLLQCLNILVCGFNIYKALSDLGLNNTKLTDIISIHEKHAKKQLGELNVKSFPRYYNTQF